ncbi:stearoyl-CoA 9-desaturase [Oleiphilus sp. HI0009]|uniref:acyl-CoA desaturase n=1 Tax=unclassified Oleiphilus TaxID=2631174 RepID=UPI0007C23BF4|nr:MULTISPECIES: acyl-CoA desaturase [unclassified Oleiphilus]KZX76415.1 stearoyl-CoA 9-desaturase [Oleiphilus sp. HI0009]KZY66871.1 stearoyl-CoA 9-desaturase [Oleiphilus sp. HI0066]KZY67611.1 stearoyl-CoA 9-desaturase [Oleiphilus sp. HI0067]
MSVVLWFDAEASAEQIKGQPNDINWLRCLPFIIVHVACLNLIWLGWSPIGVAICLGFFWLRMYAITAVYHRYFAHRAYKMNRFWQFFFAVIASSSAQRGPLWWAAHHRNHHKFSDTDHDLHSPINHSFWWSHVGWFLSNQAYKTDYDVVPDLAKYPELVFLNRFDSLMPILAALGMYGLGELLAATHPELGTNGLQLVVWGFCVSTVLLFHSTFTINSLGHVWGKRRFNTKDQSRNNGWLALLTLGEGWHNNHHRFAVSARQGFYWWEIDISYYVIKLLSFIGITRELKPVPSRILLEGKQHAKNASSQQKGEIGESK